MDKSLQELIHMLRFDVGYILFLHYKFCLLQIMYARNIDQRSAVFQKALEVGEAYHLRTKVDYNPV